MRIDIRGRVQNTRLPHSNCLLPLFEAISNSIHAIQDARNGTGRIDVTIHRDTSQKTINPDQLLTAPVSGFTIRDDGVGFTDSNYASFDTSDSLHKAERGGKGIGRLLWLKAFDHAEVDSVYREGKKTWRRRFKFTLSEQGVTDYRREEHDGTPVTTVKLVGFGRKYRDECSRSAEALAKRIIEHCLETFVLSDCPRINLIDEVAGRTIDINALFRSEVTTSSEEFLIKGQTFKISHVRALPGHGHQHRIHFCAHNRSVRSEGLEGRVPNLEPALMTEEGRSFIYTGYVSGRYLDAKVLPERTDFDLLAGDGAMYPNELSWPGLLDDSIAKAAGYLESFTIEARQKKEARIRQYVQTKAPQFRSLIKHKPEALDRVPPGLSDERLDLELYRLAQEYDAELQVKYKEILESLAADPTDLDEHRAKFARFLEEWNEQGIAKLAQHVMHRKATLSFLASRLHRQDDGKYHKEESVHQIIFPLKATSDDIPSDQMNLWILDEKLAYHYYLASDIPFGAAEPVEVDSQRRPDLLIFNHPIAFADSAAPFGSVVLVEFKRPSRDDYTDDENPIEQVYRYIELLRSGKAKDRHGKPINLPANLPIHAYVICDFTPTLHKHAKDRDFLPAADAQSYFNFHRNHGAFTEIMTFDKLIETAQRRNAILFKQMGME